MQEKAAIQSAEKLAPTTGFCQHQESPCHPSATGFPGRRITYRAFTEAYLDGRWVKATPAFSRELCRRHNVAPLEFDRRSDRSFSHSMPRSGDTRNTWNSSGPVPICPWPSFWSRSKRTYGEARVESWIGNFGKGKGRPLRILIAKMSSTKAPIEMLDAKHNTS